MDGAVCSLARQNLEHPYVLIIDEINRGNLSKVLGERMMLLEADKRSPSGRSPSPLASRTNGSGYRRTPTSSVR